MPWSRSGYCCRCGDCCFDNCNIWDSIETEKLYGPKPARPPAVKGYCPMFKWNGDKGCCVSHEPRQENPDFLETNPRYKRECASWPRDPSQIADMPNCTYKFEWIDE